MRKSQPISIRPATDPQETYQWIDDLLNAQSQDQTGHGFVYDAPIVLEAWDGDTRLGGLSAKVGREWVFVELLALSDAARGKGIGTQLIGQVEALASERGKTGIWLDTYSFQAPGFYEKLGYTEIGHITDYPTGHARHFFAKRLDGAPVTQPDETKT